MKNILFLIAAMAFVSAPALADHHMKKHNHGEVKCEYCEKHDKNHTKQCKCAHCAKYYAKHKSKSEETCEYCKKHKAGHKVDQTTDNAGHGKPAHERMHSKFFEQYDTDGDGLISKAEYAQKAEAHFNNMDKDNSGFISQDEATDVRHEMKVKIKERWKKKKKERIGDADKNLNE